MADATETPAKAPTKWEKFFDKLLDAFAAAAPVDGFYIYVPETKPAAEQPAAAPAAKAPAA